MLQMMPEEFRRRLKVVIVLRDLEELPEGEVTAIMDTSVLAVKARLHRARLVLRGKLERYMTEPRTRQ